MCVLRQCLADVRVSSGEWSLAEAARLQLPALADAGSLRLDRHAIEEQSPAGWRRAATAVAPTPLPPNGSNVVWL